MVVGVSPLSVVCHHYNIITQGMFEFVVMFEVFRVCFTAVLLPKTVENRS